MELVGHIIFTGTSPNGAQMDKHANYHQCFTWLIF